MNIDAVCKLKILIVDDEPQILLSVKAVLGSAGMKNVTGESDSVKAVDLLAKKSFHIVILDLLMPSISGMEMLRIIKEKYPHITVIMLTAVNEVGNAVTCIQAGAADHLVKPIMGEELVASVEKAWQQQVMQAEIHSLKKHLLGDGLLQQQVFADIITSSPKMQAIFKYLEAIANSCQPVLLEGETGTGKELIALALHKLSRPGEPFVPVNVAGLDDANFSDTLFGHIRGAYTGADQSRNGMIFKAGNGLLFLDEIGELTESSQVKLLRLLQEKSYYPLGDDQQKKISTRFVFATNVELEKAVEEKKFRKDLYYRLNSHRILLPPLRQRKEDLPLLVDHFLGRAALELDKAKPTPPEELFTLLATYDFPGNIRELESMVHNAVSLHSSGKLSMASFKEIIYARRAGRSDDSTENTSASLSLSYQGRLPTLKEAEKLVIAEAMRQSCNNQGIAASFLGISRQALNRRLLIMKA